MIGRASHPVSTRRPPSANDHRRNSLAAAARLDGDDEVGGRSRGQMRHSLDLREGLHWIGLLSEHPDPALCGVEKAAGPSDERATVDILRANEPHRLIGAKWHATKCPSSTSL